MSSNTSRNILLYARGQALVRGAWVLWGMAGAFARVMCVGAAINLGGFVLPKSLGLRAAIPLGVDFTGRFIDDTIKMEVHSHINGRRSDLVHRFVSSSFPPATP